MLAKEAHRVGEIDDIVLSSNFAKKPAIVVVYNDPTMYLEALKRQNNFFMPERKKHARVWQTLEKLRDIWEACDCPHALVEADNERRRRTLVSFAIVLDMEVPVGTG